jgi:hypothetical protein
LDLHNKNHQGSHILAKVEVYLYGSQLIIPWVVTFFAVAGFLLIGEMQNQTSKIGLGDAEKQSILPNHSMLVTTMEY